MSEGPSNTESCVRAIGFLVVTLVLAACGGPIHIGGGSTALTGRVGNYGLPSAELLATTVVFDGVYGETIVLGSGSIDADGNFEFTFRNDPNPKRLEVLFSSSDVCSAVSLSDDSVPGASVVALDVVPPAGGSPIGVIGRASSSAGLEHVVTKGSAPEGTVVAIWVFVADELSVQGDCASESYHLDLAAGWNEVLTTFGTEMVTFESGVGPGGTSWQSVASPVASLGAQKRLLVR